MSFLFYAYNKVAQISLFGQIHKVIAAVSSNKTRWHFRLNSYPVSRHIFQNLTTATKGIHLKIFPQINSSLTVSRFVNIKNISFLVPVVLLPGVQKSTGGRFSAHYKGRL